MNIVINQLDNLALDNISFNLAANSTKEKHDIEGILVGSNGILMNNSFNALTLLEKSNFRNQIGQAAYATLITKPMMIFSYPTSDEEFDLDPQALDQKYGTSAIHFNNFAQTFSLGCWFIKDSCVNSTSTYWTNLFNNYFCHFHRDTKCTMSNGTISQISLTKPEIPEAINRMYQIYCYLLPDESKMGEITCSSSGNTLIWNIDKAISTEGNSFARALTKLQEARSTGVLSSKIDKYCSILECLYALNKDHKSLISNITAAYIGNDDLERERIRADMRDAYSIRSDSSHGDSLKILKSIPDFDLEKLSTRIDDYVRRVFRKVINNKALNHGNSSEEKAKTRKFFKDLAESIFPNTNQNNNQQ